MRVVARLSSCRHAILVQPCSYAQRRAFSSILPVTPHNRVTKRLHSTSDRVGNDSVLFVSPVWPERTSSAAGVRTSDLIASFLEKECKVSYAAMASPNKHSEALARDGGVEVYPCQANRVDDFKRILDAARPTTVVFDRYYAEEMFSYIVRDHIPDAMRVLDMQDVHFLRTWRQKVVGGGETDLWKVIRSMPPSTYEPCLRELASIYRCDVTCVCSPREIEILQHQYGVDEDRLVEAGFFNEPQCVDTTSFGERHDAMMIGNFRHPPNADSVQWACRFLWPAVRSAMKDLGVDRLPSLHVYGAYGEGQAGLHDPEHGIEFHGFAPSLDMMSQYRVLFAPLRFGAGLKGKIVDAWKYGCPVITTPVGSEGMGDHNCNDWGGFGTAITEQDIIRDFIALYTDKEVWFRCQTQGFHLLDVLYNRERTLTALHESLHERYTTLTSWRNSKNYIGEILWSQSMRCTEYFSRWIELKETCSKDE